MKVEPVRFPPRRSKGIELEGLLLDGSGRPCVVSHPHPLAGGTMDHPIVVAVWRAAAEAGFKTLRYNFRGVERSTGDVAFHANQLAVDDLEGAIDFLGGGPLPAIGYSYGARTTLHAMLAGAAIERAALVSLPTRTPSNRAAMSNLLLGRPVRTEEHVETPDLELIADAPRPVRVFAGDRDPLVQPDELRARGVEPVLFAGLNHFFSRRLGNQDQDPRDLEILAAAVLAFLRGA